MKKQSYILGALLIALMGVMLWRPDVARTEAADALTLCGKTVIPSLFPFIFLSGCLAALPGLFSGGRVITWLMERCFQLPSAGSTAMILGAVGGYPMGARTALELHRQGTLSRLDAKRLVAFCSNAGPGFVFGMVAQSIGARAAAVVFVAHLLAAMMVGLLLPGQAEPVPTVSRSAKSLSFSQLMTQSVETMLKICSCILLFGVLSGYVELGLSALNVHPLVGAVVAGLLELTTGISRLPLFADGLPRLYAAAVFLSFGGLCIYLQTLSLTEDRELLRLYLPGKLLQTILTVLILLSLNQSPFWLILPLGLCLLRNRAGNPRRSIV